VSEMINNREYRQKVLKELITQLHQGKSVEEVKVQFEKTFQGVSASEIAEMERALVMEGMPVQQIQKLCDVHAAVFKGSIEEIHRPEKPEETPGHPVHTLKLENRALEKLINDKITPHAEQFRAFGAPESLKALLEDIELLGEVDKHYLRKENLLFPYMEKYGITAPPKVMWGVDDEIRDAIKEAKELLSGSLESRDQALEKVKEATDKITEMIFKEENIMLPMVLETLTEDEWATIAEASDEFGYTLITPKGKYRPQKAEIEKKAAEQTQSSPQGNAVQFDAGFLTPEEINAMLNTLPLDITFVNTDGNVKYFTQGKERIFARPKTIIGRHVTNCHPPASVHIVEQIVEDLKSGKKDHEDFWIKMGSKFVFIRYFAVRNEKGEYLGTMEVTQDIKPIQDITGEKRLVSE
jgi:DUF438 domain-containing protein